MNRRNMTLKCKNCKEGIELKGVSLSKETIVKCGVCGTKNKISSKKNGRRIVV